MVIWGIGSRRGQVPGGRQEQRRCTECEKQTLFYEANVTDSFEIFFVELGGVRQRRMICSECGQDVPVDGEGASARPSTPSSSKASAPTPPSRPIEKDVSKALAELKKKMGK